MTTEAQSKRSARAAEFVQWYLRFNGYFSIENFIVHEADTPKKIKGGVVPEMTECDIIGVRLPYSIEVADSLCMANHAPLVDGSVGKIDIVLGEIKTGKDNSPNKIWINASQHREMIEYIVRFCGAIPDGDGFVAACRDLSRNYIYEDEHLRIRYMLFCNEEHDRHKKRGVSYITHRSIVDFLIGTRGQSWTGTGIGVASRHQQWSPLIKDLFAIANDQSLLPEKQVEKAIALIDLG